MISKIFLITILFICGCSTIQILTDKIVNQEANFSVTKIDSEWQLSTKRVDIIVKKINTIIISNKNIDGHIFITSWRLKWGEKFKKIEAYVPDKIIELKKTNTIQNWSAMRSTFNDMDAIEITYDGRYKGKDIIFKKDEHIYIIRFLIKPEFYEQGKQYFEQILESFTFTNVSE